MREEGGVNGGRMKGSNNDRSYVTSVTDVVVIQDRQSFARGKDTYNEPRKNDFWGEWKDIKYRWDDIDFFSPLPVTSLLSVSCPFFFTLDFIVINGCSRDEELLVYVEYLVSINKRIKLLESLILLVLSNWEEREYDQLSSKLWRIKMRFTIKLEINKLNNISNLPIYQFIH